MAYICSNTYYPNVYIAQLIQIINWPWSIKTGQFFYVKLLPITKFLRVGLYDNYFIQLYLSDTYY